MLRAGSNRGRPRNGARRRWVLLLTMLVAGLAGAADAPAPAGVLDPDWRRIDTPNSRAAFVVRVAWIRSLPGRFDHVEGVIARQPERGTLSIDVRLAAQSLSMHNPEHAQWAQSEEFFDGQRHPWIRFVAEGVDEAMLRDGGELRGELSLRGITRPIALEVNPSDCERPGLDCAVEVHGELRRSDFGMQARRFVVSDKVRLDFAIRVRDGGRSP